MPTFVDFQSDFGKTGTSVLTILASIDPFGLVFQFEDRLKYLPEADKICRILTKNEGISHRQLTSNIAKILTKAVTFVDHNRPMTDEDGQAVLALTPEEIQSFAETLAFKILSQVLATV